MSFNLPFRCCRCGKPIVFTIKEFTDIDNYRDALSCCGIVPDLQASSPEGCLVVGDESRIVDSALSKVKCSFGGNNYDIDLHFALSGALEGRMLLADEEEL